MCVAQKKSVICRVWCSGKEDLEENRRLKETFPIVKRWGWPGAPHEGVPWWHWHLCAHTPLNLWTAETLHSSFPSPGCSLTPVPQPCLPVTLFKPTPPALWWAAQAGSALLSRGKKGAPLESLSCCHEIRFRWDTCSSVMQARKTLNELRGKPTHDGKAEAKGGGVSLGQMLKLRISWLFLC